MAKNASNTAEDIRNKLLEKLDSSSVPSLIDEAIGAGIRLGLADAVRRIGDITMATAALNFTGPAPKRERKPKGVIQCPVPNCPRPGIRPQRNFCKHHVDTLDAKKRESLRAKQVEANKKEKEKAREAEVAAARAQLASPNESTAAA